MEALPLLVPMGLAAGLVTTVAGLGGGMLLLAGLAYLEGPMAALALTAPALLVGNLHRVWLFRDHLDRRILKIVATASFLGALVGGLLATALPAWLLSLCIVGAVSLALSRAAGLWQWAPPVRWLAPAGVVGGIVSATSGAGVVTGSLLWAAGLTGATYVATASASAAAMHLARSAAYGVGGEVTLAGLAASMLLAASIAAGNLGGRSLRDRVSKTLSRRAEIAVLGVCAVVSVASAFR